MALSHITEETFPKEVLEASEPVIVDFYADWCGPCKMLAPVIDELAKEYDGKIKFVKLNVDEASSIAAAYSVMSIPTVIRFENGKAAKKMVGFRSKDAVIRELLL